MPSNNAKENSGRLGNFKNKSKDLDEMRRRRTDVTVELRRAKKDEQMLKRRNVNMEPETPLAEVNQRVPLNLSIPAIVENIQSTNPKVVFSGVQSCRKLLAKGSSPPLDEVIQSGIVPKLVELLGSSDSKLQFEATWALTNIASGNSRQTRAVVDAGGVPVIIQLLSSPHMNVVDQAVWALGNIAGDGSDCRDFTIRNGIIPPLLALIKPDIFIEHLCNLAWALSNLCRNKDPPPSFETAQQLLPALAHLLCHKDTGVVVDSCWALSYLTDGNSERIQAVIQSGVVPKLVDLLGSDHKIVTPALRAIGNIVTGTDHQTQVVLDYHALLHFPKLLCNSKSTVQKEAAWAISNITAGQPHQIQAVVDAGLIKPIIDIMAKGEYNAQKEAVWAITNLTAGGNIDHVVHAVECGAIKPLCDMLVVKDTKIVMVILDALMNILEAAAKVEQVEQVCIVIEECDGLNKIEALQQHENRDVYQLALSIIDKFFSAEDDDEAVVPNTEDGGFKFAPAAQNIPANGFVF